MKFNPNILSDPLGGLATQYGVPSCMVGLAKDALSLLPGNILGGMSQGLSEGKAAAQNAMSNIFNAIHDDLGILEFNTLTGKISLIGDSSQFGADGALNGIAKDIGFILGGAQAIWQAGQDISDQIEAISNCLDDFSKWLDATQDKADLIDKSDPEAAIARTKGKFLVYQNQIESAQDFINRVDETLANIESVLSDRTLNPDLIPVYATSGTIPEEDVSPIFRLTYGPPQAKKGQFLLSVDGIYYDSQNRTYASGSPVPTTKDLAFIPAQDRWKLDHSPNLGGRGTAYTLDDLSRYVDTLFDINSIDSNEFIKKYYDADHFLQVLEAQKNQTVSNLTKNIVNLTASGYSKESALYINYTEQIKSQNAAYNTKIKKRKKQIEVAVKAPDLFGVETMYAPGKVPINDFSFLSSINLDVEITKQKNLTFDHGEVSGIILPIVPTYVKSEGIASKVVLTPLEIPPQGIGENIEDDQELDFSKPSLSLVTQITTDGLQAVYNFADTNIQSPDSTVFNTLNCAALGEENRAQTVSDNVPLLYNKGLGIPYLAGIPRYKKPDANHEFKGETFNTYPFTVDGVGNYVKLPDTASFQDLMYSREGATIDLWTYMDKANSLKGGTKNFSSHPYDTSAFQFNLSSADGSWCDGQYTKVLLGCENTGGENLNTDSSAVILNRSSNNVRGMLMGLSRDLRMVRDSVFYAPPNDFTPTYYLKSVDSTDYDPAENENITGIWTLSSDSGNPKPEATVDASGTYSVRSGNNLSFVVTNAGYQYDSSAHEVSSVLWVSGNDGTTDYGPSAVSATINLEDNVSNLDYVFFVAPTQSYNTSDVGFVKGGGCSLDEDAPYLKFTVPSTTTVNGISLEDIESKFINLQIVFEPSEDLVKFYINSELVSQKAISQIFDVPEKSAPQVPSFAMPFNVATSSFYYSKQTVNQTAGVTLFDNGPKNYPQFTPWIVGGGWTDGRPVNLNTSSGGFLDAGSGIISSYNGWIGNLKIYNKALNTKELKANYEAQTNFFDNIDLSYDKSLT
jgi:hypothetical protein